MRRILIPVDGSRSAVHAVHHVISFFNVDGETEIHLLHVQPPLAVQDIPDLAQPGLLERLQMDEADRAFASAQKLLNEAGLRHTARSAIGDPAQEIAMYANVHRCTEIVMGTRGMGALKNVLLGSVAMKVLHLVEIPVTLVK